MCTFKRGAFSFIKIFLKNTVNVLNLGQVILTRPNLLYQKIKQRHICKSMYMTF